MKNKILIVISFLVGTLMFSSCLKDKLTEDWTSSLSGKMYAQIVNAGFQSSTIAPSAADQTIRVFVNIATDALPTKDVTLNLTIDAAALTAYNTANGKSFVLCPNVTVSSVIIKAGTRNGYGYITLKSANLLDLTKTYAVPVSISSVSDPNVIIASNFKTEILQVPVANQWEGSYKSTGHFDHPTSPRDLNSTKRLTTVDATTVTGPHSDLGGSGYTITIKINPDNTCIVTQYAGGVLLGEMTPGAVNKYNPETKVFTLNYRYSGSGGYRTVSETLTFLNK
ncbi:MAG: DUF1735 domain-containing protein [Bacteroidetes bacterium]|nr:DUF1735 domain-containing protein [Bacteroidota bacterium]